MSDRFWDLICIPSWIFFGCRTRFWIIIFQEYNFGCDCLTDLRVCRIQEFQRIFNKPVLVNQPTISSTKNYQHNIAGKYCFNLYIISGAPKPYNGHAAAGKNCICMLGKIPKIIISLNDKVLQRIQYSQ